MQKRNKTRTKYSLQSEYSLHIRAVAGILAVTGVPDVVGFLVNAVVHAVVCSQAAACAIADAGISVDCVHVGADIDAVACCPFVAGIPAVTGNSSVAGVLPFILLLS